MAFPKSNAIDNGGGEKEYHGIPNENNSSDSDSGNSIFLTQADTVAPPLRKARRRHQASSQSSTSALNDSADSESEEASTSIEPHNETGSRQQPSSCKHKKPEIPCVPKRPIRFPFLEQYYGVTYLSLHQQQTLVNSSIGGFFRCMKTLTDKNKRPELSSSPVSDISSLEEESEDLEDQDFQDDTRIVDSALFVQNLHKRNRQEWCSNTKNSPSEVKTKKGKKTKKKPPSTKDVSKAQINAQSRRSKRSNPSEAKNTRKGQNTEDVSKIGQCQTRRSERHAVKRANGQNLSGYGSCSSSDEGSEMRGGDNSSVLETSKTGQHLKTYFCVTSRPTDASGTEDEQTDNDQTDTGVNQLQAQSSSLETTECEPSQHVAGVTQFSESSDKGVPVCEVTTGEATSVLTQVTSNAAFSEGLSSEKPNIDCDTDTHEGLTFDDDSQSTAEPQASQQISSNIVSSESHQGLSGGNNSPMLHHLKKRKQKKKRQSETYSDQRFAFPKDMIFEDHDKSGSVGGDTIHKKAAPQVTRNSLPSEELYKTGKCPDPVSEDEWNASQDYSCTPVQCVELSTVPNVEDKRETESSSSQNMVPSSTLHILSQKKKKTVNKGQIDTVEMILQGTSRLAASESHVQLGWSETETCLDAEESLEHTGNGLGVSQPQLKTQIQLVMDNDTTPSQDCEMLSVDGDSSAKKKRKRKKKKHKEDCMESVKECSASREMISISKDITLCSAPDTENKISYQRNRKKHKCKEDRVQQDSQEHVNSQPEGLSDQPRDRTKNKKKVYNPLTSEQSPSSAAESVSVIQHSSSQVCEVADSDGKSVSLNTLVKKNKRKKDVETVIEEESSSHKEANSFSPENQVTFLQEAAHKKKKKRRKLDSEHCVLQDGSSLVSDDQRLVQQTGTETQVQVFPEQSVNPSDGSDSGRKRKKYDRVDNACPSNICSGTDAESEMLCKKKKKKKRHRSENSCELGITTSEDNGCGRGCDGFPSNICSATDAESEMLWKKKKKKRKMHRSENSCELGITTSEDNGSQGLEEAHEREKTCPSVRSPEKENDQVEVYCSAPGGHHAEQRGCPSKEKRKKRNTLLDTTDANPDESLSLSVVPHKKKKKKKAHDETCNELKESVVSADITSVMNDTGIPDSTNIGQRVDDGPAVLNSEREGQRSKKKKSKH